jgi:hypothetical protein
MQFFSKTRGSNMGKLKGFSSRFFSSQAVAILSIAPLLCGLSGTAMSQTQTPSGGTTLPSITVQAPKQRVAKPQKPKEHAVARETVRTAVYPGRSPSPTAATVRGPWRENHH